MNTNTNQRATTDTRDTITARGGFGLTEEIAWQAERSAAVYGHRLYYRNLASVARHFHVWINRDTGTVLLPDPSEEPAPITLWAELDRAGRHLNTRLPRIALTLAVMALRGQLDAARAFVDDEGLRCLTGVLNLRLVSEERTWLKEEGAVIGAEPYEPTPPLLVAANDTPLPAPAIEPAETLSDADVDDFAAVLRTLKRDGGKVRVARLPWEIIEGTGLDSTRVFQVLKRLEGLGRIRQLADHRWIEIPRS